MMTGSGIYQRFWLWINWLIFFMAKIIIKTQKWELVVQNRHHHRLIFLKIYKSDKHGCPLPVAFQILMMLWPYKPLKREILPIPITVNSSLRLLEVVICAAMRTTGMVVVPHVMVTAKLIRESKLA
jgi:hypothetical protein